MKSYVDLVEGAVQDAGLSPAQAESLTKRVLEQLQKITAELRSAGLTSAGVNAWLRTGVPCRLDALKVGDGDAVIEEAILYVFNRRAVDAGVL